MSNVITTKTQFENELARVISEEIERLRDQLEYPTSEMAGTQFMRGQILALRTMPDLMKAAQERIDKRNS